tara:strand:+ start:132 stop:971 length:840 start_codon:yes stop_codon:yes gene_type:complete
MHNIGFIGLGAMGSAMAPLLVKAGFNVFGFDIKKKIHSKTGIINVENIHSLSDKDVIIFMLPDGKEVSKTAEKLIKLNTKSIMIDMSSSHPDDTILLGKKLMKQNLTLIDAPVSGGVAKAKTGELMIMVGGEVIEIEKVQKILQVMGKVEITGPLGSGHAMKSLNNYVSAAGLIASLEALNAARKVGIYPENFIRIINGATGKNNTTEVKLDKFVISKKYNSGFALNLMVKDVSIANGLIENLTKKSPLSKNVLGYLNSSLSVLGKEADHTEIYKVLNK